MARNPQPGASPGVVSIQNNASGLQVSFESVLSGVQQLSGSPRCGTPFFARYVQNRLAVRVLLPVEKCIAKIASGLPIGQWRDAAIAEFERLFRCDLRLQEMSALLDFAAQVRRTMPMRFGRRIVQDSLYLFRDLMNPIGNTACFENIGAQLGDPLAILATKRRDFQNRPGNEPRCRGMI